MKLPHFTFFLFLTLPGNIMAWQSTESISIGTTHSIYSEVYGQPKQLMVALPTEVTKQNQKLPVLYILDGQHWFLEAVSQYRILSHYGYLPPMIIVGVNTDDSPRYGFFAGTEKLQNHFAQEIIPYVEANFQASSERLISGWQFASAFIIKTLAERPELFDGWLAASPFPIQGQTMSLIRERLNNESFHGETLIFATSLHENKVETGAIELATLLEQKAPDNFRWKYHQLQHEPKVAAGHRTTPLGNLYTGLRTYFENYPVLELNNLDEYKDLGGHDYVTSYYQKRSQLYGFTTDIPQEGMFFLIRMGLNSEDLSLFDFYMQQFIDKGFIESNNIGWNMNFANFYLEQEHAEKALELYQRIAKAYPESPRPVHGMARAYQTLNNKEEALSHFEKAIKMAEQAADHRLEQYKSDLEKLKKNG